MKLQENVNKVRRSENFEEIQYTIAATAKAFSVLSDSLYQNKIKAIIRELSCNAYDAHVESGKNTLPFSIHLPNYLDRTFRIRDFGMGISPEDIVEIYTKYFASTKTNSNELVGCLGLGSKTPFSYTDNFSVISYYNGMKRVYSNFVSEDGSPSIAKISEEETDEPSGLEIQFAVKEPDFSRFEREAINVFRWFKTLPIFDGTSPYIDNKIEKTRNGTGWFVSNSHVGPGAVMGNVFYLINTDNLKTFIDEGFLTLLDHAKPVLEFPIGALSVAPSRESLSYEKRTIKAIEKRLESVKLDVESELATELAQCTSKWEASLKLLELRNGSLGSYIKAIIDKGNSFKWGQEEIKSSYSSEDLFGPSSQPHVMSKFWFEHQWRTDRWTTKYEMFGPPYKEYKTYKVSPKTIHIFANTTLDPSTGNPLLRKFTASGFRTWMRAFESSYQDITFRVFEDTETAVFDKIIAGLGLEKGVSYFYWHDMPKTPKIPKGVIGNGGGGGRKKIESKTMRVDSWRCRFADRWRDYEKVDLENGCGFYIERLGFVPRYNQSEYYNMDSLVRLISKWNSYAQTLEALALGHKEIKVHSFTPTQMKTAGPLWVSIIEFAQTIGPTLWSTIPDLEERLFHINRDKPKIDTDKLKVFKWIIKNIPGLEQKSLWKEIVSDVNTYEASEDVNVINEFNNFVSSDLRLTPDETKFAKYNERVSESMKQIQDDYELLKMFFDHNRYLFSYKKEEKDILGFTSIVEFIKFKENL